MIRLAQEADAAEILAIYEPYIKETPITLEFDIPSLDEFKNRLNQISSEYPYIVYLVNGRITGYAYAHRQMERAAYQWNAELSVYVDKNWLRCGAGRALYGALIEILKLQNIHNVYGCVTFPNQNSERLHEYFGFKQLGIFHSTGYKCGVWHDVAWFEKTIKNYEHDPKPFLSIQEIDRNKIIEILNRTSSLYSKR